MSKKSAGNKTITTSSYLKEIGLREIPPRTSPFDPGYDPVTLVSHLEQSSSLISCLKVSMACWQIASEEATRKKVSAARRLKVPVCTGGGPFEIAVHFGKLPQFLDLCADIGFTRIEAGEGFTDMRLKPAQVCKMASERGLEVQFEIGKKHGGTFKGDAVQDLIDQGRIWLEEGALQVVVEARESAKGVGVFDENGELNKAVAERFVKAYGMERTVFEAPNKPSQFAFLNHFGPGVYISNVRIEELLRVEIYRRGLHSDAFGHANLRPKGPKKGK